MGLKDVLISLNNLITEGIIQDYAIAGGYAVMYYDIPISTFDLDVLVLLSSENDYHRLYEHFKQQGSKMENVYIYINDMPVHFLPNYIGPLFNDAIKKANIVEFEGISSKFISIEYLIVLLLTSFRLKDKIRIQSLINKANKDLLLDIIKRFDNDDHQLYERYKEVLEST